MLKSKKIYLKLPLVVFFFHKQLTLIIQHREYKILDTLPVR